MYYADYHMHSSCSFDAENTMSEMSGASASFGLREICFTDHCDMLDGELKNIVSWSWDEIDPQYFRALMDHGSEIKIKLGIELGNALSNISLAESIVSREALDFVIGSVHVLPDLGDCYDLEYTDEEYCNNVISRYIAELEKLAKWGKFDVMGHITYPLRYIRGRAGFKVDYGDFVPRIESLYRTLIENGRGIELNTSNLKNGGETMPYIELLELYKNCGGEIITLGSDAHRVSDAGSGIPHGYDILGYCGFKYFTVFDHRTPQFIKL